MTVQPLETEIGIEVIAEKGEEIMIATAKIMIDIMMGAVTGKEIALAVMIQGTDIGHVLGQGIVLGTMTVTGTLQIY